MSNCITMLNGETVDLDTLDGCYRYVANHLLVTGADSTTFCAFGKLYPKPEPENDPNPVKWTNNKTSGDL